MNRKEILAKPSGITLEVVRDFDSLLSLETQRVQRYKDHYQAYKKHGYASILRFPIGTDLETYDSLPPDVEQTIQRELSTDFSAYEKFTDQLLKSWDKIQEKALPVASALYGYQITGSFKVVPTAYGTVGGQESVNSPIFFRIPKYRPSQLGSAFTTGQYCNETELLLHEIVVHAATAAIRNNTALDEEAPKCSHQWHKEYLMDVLGRSIAVRAGLMPREQVAMQIKGIEEAACDIDPFYYNDPLHPNEHNLRFDGKLPQLVIALDKKLKSAGAS